MLAFAIRRLFEALTVMLTVALIAFALFRYVGDPVNQMVGQDATPADRAELRRHLGLDDPVIVAAALQTGALGYVLKARAGTDLEPAIRAALAGQTMLSPALVTALATARGTA